MLKLTLRNTEQAKVKDGGACKVWPEVILKNKISKG